MSQSLHFLRAFQPQGDSRNSLENGRSGRNPFIFLGHFNLWTEVIEDDFHESRNPFIFLGHFNSRLGLSRQKKAITRSRNPFIFLGHFNKFLESPRGLQEFKSQSLHFLRAFQHSLICRRIRFIYQSRNPFIFLGHFNIWARAFPCPLFSVAIPSFS